MSAPYEPEPPSEYESSRPLVVSRAQAVHLKNFTERLRVAKTLIALDAVRRDIQRSDMQSNVQILEQLRSFANVRAVELGFKGNASNNMWWK